MQSTNVSMHNKRITASTTTTTTANNNNNANPHRRTTTITPQACAACKYQRRKCAADCILAPYFPHDRQQQFLNAHRLFGVSNIVKILRPLEPPEKDVAMRTIIFQSEARAADPVGGCYRIIRDLEQQINLATAELEIVLHHLALCRAACRQEQAAPPLPQPDGGDLQWRGRYGDEDDVVVIDDVNSWSCMDGINVNANPESSSLSTFQHHHDHDHRHMRSLSMEECNHDIKIILDQLSGNYEEEYKFYSRGDILPSNNAFLTEEDATVKEENGPISYIQDQDDLKAAATFFTLTNYDI